MKKLFSLILLVVMVTGCTSHETVQNITVPLEDPAACASRLSHLHGVDIRIGEHAAEVLPWDYDIISETDPQTQLDALTQLEHCLNQYPSGMVRVLSEDAGGLHICIVREIQGKDGTESLESAKGLQFQDKEEGAFLMLARDLPHTLYHELCHVLEDFVLPRSDAWESWQDLNPEGFVYDMNLEKNLERDSSSYLQEKDRAFVDTYSMSFPREDRARIMEYAMTEGNEDLFASPIMQQKLLCLSQGIREAISLTDSDLELSWERYLIK